MWHTTEEKLDRTYTNIMAIDLGLNNIVACTNKENNNSMLVSGKELKSKNRYLNKEIEHLTSNISQLLYMMKFI